RNIGREPELIRRVAARRIDDEPNAGLRPVYGHVCLTVTIVIGRNDLIRWDAPLNSNIAAGRLVDIPHTCRRPVHGYIGLPVPVVIADNRLVAAGAVLDDQRAVSARTLPDPETAGRWPKDGDVGLAVTIKIARCRNILRQTPVGAAVGAVTASIDKKDAAGGPVYG